MEKREYFVVVPNSSFAELYAYTLEEARSKLENFGTLDETSEYYEYWKSQREQCKIYRVTEIREEIQ